MMQSLEERVLILEQQVTSLLASRTVVKPAATTEAATDAELDARYGNPAVRRNPPRWDGESFEGRPFSACPPEFLETLASFLEWRATKEEAEPGKEKYAVYSRKDARLAKGWARRLRQGPAQSPTPPTEKGGADGADDVPF